MAQPGEEQASTIVDMLVARQQAAAADDKYSRTKFEQQRLIDSSQLRAGEIAVRFSVQPSRGADNLTAHLMHFDNVEDSIGTPGTPIRTRKVTRSKPFEAGRYHQTRHHFQHSSFDGWYEFEAGQAREEIAPDVKDIRTWVLQIPMNKLGEVDIKETRNGLLVAYWMAGQVVPVNAGRPQLEIAQAEAIPLA